MAPKLPPLKSSHPTDVGKGRNKERPHLPRVIPTNVLTGACTAALRATPLRRVIVRGSQNENCGCTLNYILLFYVFIVNHFVRLTVGKIGKDLTGLLAVFELDHFAFLSRCGMNSCFT